MNGSSSNKILVIPDMQLPCPLLGIVLFLNEMQRLLRTGLSYQILSTLLGSSQQGQRSSVPLGGRADAIPCLSDFVALLFSHLLKCEKQT